MTLPNEHKIIPLILCGGSGSRLWPLSREAHPKQFVDLGNGQSLCGDAIKRALAFSPEILIVGNILHKVFIRKELEKISGNVRVILEPAQKNTAPAITLAALALNEMNPDALLLVMPSDHELDDLQAFGDAVSNSAGLAQGDFIVTFGINPLYAATGFGYLEKGERLNSYSWRINKFVEKPDVSTARTMLGKGGYFWNSGIFLMKAATLLRELRAFDPEICNACQKAWQKRTKSDFFELPDTDAFQACPANSLDYAIMEKTRAGAVTHLASPWNDLGSWDSFFRDAPRDGDDNVIQGNALLQNAKGCHIRGSERLVAAVGVSDLTVVETEDAVLVASKGEGLQDLLTALKRNGKRELRENPQVNRFWGKYEILATGPDFKVKRLSIDQGKCISLQSHQRRSEHWVIVQGEARITIGENTDFYGANQSAYIPKTVRHKLENAGKVPLVVIEVQTGDYLEEDDISRYPDGIHSHA